MNSTSASAPFAMQAPDIGAILQLQMSIHNLLGLIQPRAPHHLSHPTDPAHAPRCHDLCSCGDEGDQKVAPSKLLHFTLRGFWYIENTWSVLWSILTSRVATVAKHRTAGNRKSSAMSNASYLHCAEVGGELSASWFLWQSQSAQAGCANSGHGGKRCKGMLHRRQQEPTACGHRPSGWKILPVAQERLSSANMP